LNSALDPSEKQKAYLAACAEAVCSYRDISMSRKSRDAFLAGFLDLLKLNSSFLYDPLQAKLQQTS
jgi:hypothetical protein